MSVPLVGPPGPATRRIELFTTTEGPDLVVLVFTSTTCPIANASIPELRRIQDRTRASQGRLVLVHPDVLATDERVLRHAAEVGLDAMLVRDPEHELVRMLQASVVPEAFVLLRSGEGWRLRYRGPLDNLYADIGRRRRQASQWYVRDALEAIDAGSEIETPVRPAIGCRIERWRP